jgi:hypothetical protein
MQLFESFINPVIMYNHAPNMSFKMRFAVDAHNATPFMLRSNPKMIILSARRSIFAGFGYAHRRAEKLYGKQPPPG